MDTLSNFFSNLKNGYLAKKYKITQIKTKQIINILNILIKEGYIKSYQISKKNHKIIYVYLKYKNNKNVLEEIKRISRPSKRIYIKRKELLKEKRGFYILSTSLGILTDLQAKQFNIGGELICQIY
jgi:small subunit ribosomal protein S8